MSLPALADHDRLRYAAFALLYAAQGIPEGLMFFALPAYLAEQGVSAAAIGGFVGVALLPWSLKLFNGPVMDRFSFLAMGRRRPWVLFGQIGLTVSFAALVLVGDPVAHLGWLTAGCFAVSFFGAFQDVAVDGMVIDVVPVRQQGRTNALMWGGKTIGIAGSTAGGAWMLNAFGFDATVLSLAAVVAAIMTVPLLLRERSGERLFPWSAGQASRATQTAQLTGWSDIVRSLFRAFLLPSSLVLALLAFLLGLHRGFSDTLLPLFTVQALGWTDTGYAELMSSTLVIAGLVGMIAGGRLVDSVGRTRTLVGALLTLVVLHAGMGLFPAVWTVAGGTAAFVYGLSLLDVLATIALFAMAMAVCWRRVSATQFSLYMAISNLGMSAGAFLFGELSRHVAYSALFFTLGLIVLLSAAVAPFVRIASHRQRLAALGSPEAEEPPHDAEVPASVPSAPGAEELTPGALPLHVDSSSLTASRPDDDRFGVAG